MPMRRSSARPDRAPQRVSLAGFGWDPATLATSVHPSFPWYDRFDEEIEIRAAGLEERRWGGRDALSILGQYAAHLAFLRFAGIEDCRFDPQQWSVITRRGSDCRLIRLSGNQPFSTGDIPRLTLLEEMAERLGVSDLRSLGDSWGKPEAVYQEVLRRLRDNVAADVSWLRRAAVGVACSPGPDQLSAAVEEPTVLLSDEAMMIDVCRRFAAASDGLETVIVGGEGVSPLRPYSAIASLEAHLGEPGDGEEPERVERILRALERRRCLLLIVSPEMFDDRSRTVIRMLASTPSESSWVAPESAAEWFTGRNVQRVIPSRQFVLSPSLEAQRLLDQQLERLQPDQRRAWSVGFVEGALFDRFLDECEIPDPRMRGSLEGLKEPGRSYLAALALIGRRVDRSLATTLLGELGARIDPEELAFEPAVSLDDSCFQFESEEIRQQLVSDLPEGSRTALLHLAAQLVERSGDLLRASVLAWQSGDAARARSLLERSLEEITGWSFEELNLPRELILTCPRVAALWCEDQIARGRYRDAREVVDHLDAADRPLVVAKIERRLGNYASALEALASVENRSFEGLVLAAELHRLRGDTRSAEEALNRADELAAPADRPAFRFERAMLALDMNRPPDRDWLASSPGGYQAARVRSYVALDEGAYDKAIGEARRAVESSPGLADRIDAELDLVYALFLAGRWDEARQNARRGLSLVEETQGDRAGGGFLFTLAYLCADEGLWGEAEGEIERLARFYRSHGDERRLAEVDLLSAHLALGHLEFDEARRRAARLSASGVSGDIAHAAHLILDECDWIDGRLSVLRTSPEIPCVELRRRHLVHQARLTGQVDDRLDGFSRSLAEWEASRLGGSEDPPPEPGGGAEKARLLRSILALLRRGYGHGLEGRRDGLAAALELTVPGGEAVVDGIELRLLRRLAVADYPPAPDALDHGAWRLVSRNRLGSWEQVGPLAPLEKEDLEPLVIELPADWVSAGERRWFYLEGLSEMSVESRAALGSLIRLRAEHHNYRRLIEQEQSTVADRPAGQIAGIVGESKAIRQILDRIARVAVRDIPVCIEGESGTGKELVARAIHQGSRRKSRSFTAVNCAALPETLIESELFGHVRGAFTGADRDRIGLIESSDGGTLFLDEIGEMPLASQAKLLRFLQEGELRRVGETSNRSADVRIVAATNRRLEKAVDEGLFREDLYYRIKVVDLAVPPLRERGGDILILARHFLLHEQEIHRSGPDRFSPEVEATFLSHRWPGNVRELQNVVRAAHAIAGEARRIDLEHLPERLRGVSLTARRAGTYYDEVTRFRRTLVERSLSEAAGNQNRAAKILGISRQSLAYQIRELGILVEKK